MAWDLGRGSAARLAQGVGLAMVAAWCTQSCKTPSDDFECAADGACDVVGGGLCRQGACYYPDDSCRPEGYKSRGKCAALPGANGSGGANNSGGSNGNGNGGSSNGGSSGSGNGGTSAGGSNGNGGGAGSTPGTSPEGGTGEDLTVAAGAIGGKGTIDGTASFARFISPSCLAFDGDHYIYVGDAYAHTIRRLDTDTAEVTTIAGYPYQSAHIDGSGSDARFANPECVAFDGTDPNSPVLYVSEWDGHRIRQVRLGDGYPVTTIAGSPDWETGLVDGVGTAAKFKAPIAMVRLGNLLYVADANNHAIRTINLNTNAVTTLIGDKAGQTSGNVDGPVAGARLETPHALALDAAGKRLFIGELQPARIRVLDLLANSVSTLIPALGGGPTSLAYDAAGNRLFATLYNEKKILSIDVAKKTPSLVAGSGDFEERDGSPSTASFRSPHGIVLAPNNTLYVADVDGPTIRKLELNGSTYQTTTIAGYPRHAGLKDATGESARFFSPGHMALAPDERTVYLVDGEENCAIRTFDLVTKQVGTLTGGAGCESVDGTGPAAQLAKPGAMTMGVAAQGAPPPLFVAELSGVVRKVDTANGSVTTLNTGDPQNLPTWRGIAATATTIYVAGEFERKIFQMPVSGGTLSDYAGTGNGGCNDVSAANSTFSRPASLLWDGGNKLYVADAECATIRRIDLESHQVETVAGGNKARDENPDGVGEDARFYFPASLQWDREHKGFYVQDIHVVRWVDATTFEVKTVVGDKDDQGGVWLSPNPVRLNHPGGFIEGEDGALYITSEGAILRWKP